MFPLNNDSAFAKIFLHNDNVNENRLNEQLQEFMSDSKKKYFSDCLKRTLADTTR